MLADAASDDSVGDTVVDAAEVDNQYLDDEHGGRRSIKHTPSVEHRQRPPLGVHKKSKVHATFSIFLYSCNS